MAVSRIEPVRRSEDWVEQGWRFSLYIGVVADEAKLTRSEMFNVTKRLVRSRVLPTAVSSETAKLGFAITSANSTGMLRAQIFWWTSEFDLHREAIQGSPHTNLWERIPPWEIGDALEVAIIQDEIAKMLHSRN